MKTKTIAILAGIVILLASAGYGIYYWQTLPGEYDKFAKCLTKEGATMYGTDWCSYCQEQKSRFGRSFKHVDFVDCDKNKRACNANGVDSYPTWKINGQSYSGVRPLENLATLTGCELEE